MTDSINTPMDALNWMKGRKVIVTSKHKDKISGTLVSFDLNQNFSIETKDGLRFIQGNNVADITIQEDQVPVKE